MAFTPLSAKFAQVRMSQIFNGTIRAPFTVTAKKWEVRPTADALDTTNFEGNGFATWLPGIYQADFTIDGDWDSASDVFAAAFPNFVIGQYVANVTLYTNLVGSPGWAFPIALIVETPMSAAVRETITFSLVCKGHGAFFYP